MKKRILGMLLCLVMVVSLLPVTAFAYSHEEAASWVVGIKNNETYCGDTYFTFDLPEDRTVDTVSYGYDDGHALNQQLFPDSNGNYKLEAGLGNIFVQVTYNEEETVTWVSGITINDGHTDDNRDHICDVCNTYTECADAAPADCNCDICGASMHRWQYTATENSLTAKCGNSGCPIGTVSVTLTAHSVTLPDSPFNAQLKFEGDFKEVFYCSEIEYQYEDSATGWEYVDPDTFTPKPGNYQAGVLITGLPGNGGAAARSMANEDGAGQGGASAYLFVKYTAADPAVTAQTGDNRPIELMIAGAAVFSVLAAAAFILDSKRKFTR